MDSEVFPESDSRLHFGTRAPWRGDPRFWESHFWELSCAFEEAGWGAVDYRGRDQAVDALVDSSFAEAGGFDQLSDFHWLLFQGLDNRFG